MPFPLLTCMPEAPHPLIYLLLKTEESGKENTPEKGPAGGGAQAGVGTAEGTALKVSRNTVG